MSDIPSPESVMMPVVRLEAHRDKTAWIATMAGTLNVSNRICVMRSQKALESTEIP